MLEKLKILLGITDNSSNTLLEYEISLVTDMVENYCRIQYLPAGLENVVVALCADLHRASGYGSAEVPSILQSLKEGDTAVSFGSVYSVSENAAMQFLKGYDAQLKRYRRVGW